MSQPGWYPDPAGAPGHFRHWDGVRWSSETTTDPRTASAPASGSGTAPVGGAPGGGPRRGRGPLFALLAGVLVLALAIWWFGVRPRTGAQAAREDTNTAAPTVSSWNESSTPSPSSSGSDDTSNAGMTDCPQAQPVTLSHPNDGRLHGGHLAADALPDPWMTSANDSGPRWATDSMIQERQIVPGWASTNMTGALMKADGFTSPKQAAYGFMSCYASSSFYDGFTGRTDLTSQAVTIDGKTGWWLRSQVRVVFAPDASITGDVVDIIVVDTGDPTLLSFWEGNATINDSAVQAQIDQVRSTVRVDQ